MPVGGYVEGRGVERVHERGGVPSVTRDRERYALAERSSDNRGFRDFLVTNNNLLCSTINSLLWTGREGCERDQVLLHYTMHVCICIRQTMQESSQLLNTMISERVLLPTSQAKRPGLSAFPGIKGQLGHTTTRKVESNLHRSRGHK